MNNVPNTDWENLDSGAVSAMQNNVISCDRELLVKE